MLSDSGAKPERAVVKPKPLTPEQAFLSEVTEHRMTIMKDEGLYRHVKFARPDSSMYRFDLVTWPGHLVICGDLEDYHFARTPDMFTFFRNNPDRPHSINPDYWAQKLTGHRQQAETYSFDAFKTSVTWDFLWNRDSIPDGQRRRVWRAIREEIFDDPDVQHSREAAYQAVTEFNVWLPGESRGESIFRFHDTYELNFTDWDWHFLISLHAIVWGIKQYDTRTHHTEAEWLREDLSSARMESRMLKASVSHLEGKVRSLEGEYQDLRNDVLRGV
jgi:hypothetical protein